jgi:hypothetical protein
VPEPKHGTRLRDVLVGMPDGVYGGVAVYESGRMMTAGYELNLRLVRGLGISGRGCSLRETSRMPKFRTRRRKFHLNCSPEVDRQMLEVGDTI